MTKRCDYGGQRGEVVTRAWKLLHCPSGLSTSNAMHDDEENAKRIEVILTAYLTGVQLETRHRSGRGDWTKVEELPSEFRESAFRQQPADGLELFEPGVEIQSFAKTLLHQLGPYLPATLAENFGTLEIVSLRSSADNMVMTVKNGPQVYKLTMQVRSLKWSVTGAD